MKYFWLVLAMFSALFAKDSGLFEKESTIPVLNLQEYFDPETREAFIEKVREASHRVGFFALKHTGVNERVLHRMYETLENFYSMDMDLKMEVDALKSGGQRGYIPFGKESAKGSKFGDVKEYYMVGRELTTEQAKDLQMPINVWPCSMDFKKPAISFFSELEVYSELLQEVFSLALYQEKDFLKKLHKGGDTSCRMIHYPTMKDRKEGEIWAEAHTDIDTFTILPKATCEGLEVMDDKGNWIPVFVQGDAMIVNVGDFLEIFSNGYFRSSMHRVKSPKHMKKDRYSCVHFVHPRHDVLLYPLSKFMELSGGKQKYAVATRNEMLFERLADLGFANDFMLQFLAERKVMERLMEFDRASPEAMEAIYKAGYASDKIKEKLGKR